MVGRGFAREPPNFGEMVGQPDFGVSLAIDRRRPLSSYGRCQHQRFRIDKREDQRLIPHS